MPINRIPIVEKQDTGNEKLKKSMKNESKMDFCISEPKYDLEDVILSENVRKAIEMFLNYLRNN